MGSGSYGESAHPFIALVRELVRCGWSHDLVAAAAGLSEGTIRHLASGEIHTVRPDTAHKLKALVLDRLTEAEAAAYRSGEWIA